MKNLKMKCSLILALSLAMTTFANAKGGGEAGNGGGAHVCYYDEGMTQLKSYETYDIFEGRKLYRIPVHAAVILGPVKDNATMRFLKQDKYSLIDQAILKVAAQYPAFAEKIKAALAIMLDNDVLVDATDINLEELPNAKRLIRGKFCRYQQVVNWLDPEQLLPGSKNKVLRDESVYQMMNSYNQAALDLHEIVYKVYRAYADRQMLIDYESRPVRKFVAQAMAGVKIDPILDENDLREGIFAVGKNKVVVRTGVDEHCSAQEVKITARLMQTEFGPASIPFNKSDRVYPIVSSAKETAIEFVPKLSNSMRIFPLFINPGEEEVTTQVTVSGCGLEPLTVAFRSKKIAGGGLDEESILTVQLDRSKL